MTVSVTLATQLRDKSLLSSTSYDYESSAPPVQDDMVAHDEVAVSLEGRDNVELHSFRPQPFPLGGAILLKTGCCIHALAVPLAHCA